MRGGLVRPHQRRVLPGPQLGRLWLLQGRPGGAHRPLEHEAQAEEAERTDPGGIPEPVLDGGIGSVFN